MSDDALFEARLAVRKAHALVAATPLSKRAAYRKAAAQLTEALKLENALLNPQPLILTGRQALEAWEMAPSHLLPVLNCHSYDDVPERTDITYGQAVDVAEDVDPELLWADCTALRDYMES